MSYNDDLLGDILSQTCPECGSDRTYLIDLLGTFKCEECEVIVDDDYWANEPELELGPGHPDYVREDAPDYLD